MFYSNYEIDLLTKIHGKELQRLCENYKCKDRNKKQPILFRLLQVLLAKVQWGKNSKVEDSL